jgi:predicted ATPase
MLTKLRIRNFKQFQDVEIELGQNVVLVGANNSGKTTVLQALALWYAGVQSERGLTVPFALPIVLGEQTGMTTINRLDVTSIPVPDVRLLWRDLHVHNGNESQIYLGVSGILEGKEWSWDLKFQYANEESFYCYPVISDDSSARIPKGATTARMGFVPPMSGLIATEDRLERGSIQRRIGEGRTAETLRNLCYQVYESNAQTGNWDKLVGQIREMFAGELLPPEYLSSRGEIRMAYKERSGTTFDLSASGRGMLQILLLLSYMYTNPGAVLLLDEPDAHLEIIRQREIYALLTKTAHQQGSQIIAASHSEVVLEEAAGLDTAIALVGKPHRIDQRSESQIKKALRDIRVVDYYQAEEVGWVLYLEGSTDLAILQAFAAKLGHEARTPLERPFVYYLEINKPSAAEDHFHGLREAKTDLVGIALFDRIPKSKLKSGRGLTKIMWQRREVENYLSQPDTLVAYAVAQGHPNAESMMREIIQLLVPPIALQNPADKWWLDTKVSDDFLDRLFEMYFERSRLPNTMRKTSYHVLANFVPKDQIDPEVIEKLDAIVAVAKQAKPRKD